MTSNSMKNVVVFGTFDFLHIGHIFFLREAKRLGDELTVCVARDSIIKDLKGKLPIHTEKERAEIMAELNIVDKVILGDRVIGRYAILRSLEPDIVAVGYDQQDLQKSLDKHIRLHNLNIKVSKIENYGGQKVKSSDIKKRLEI